MNFDVKHNRFYNIAVEKRESRVTTTETYTAALVLFYKRTLPF